MQTVKAPTLGRRLKSLVGVKGKAHWQREKFQKRDDSTPEGWIWGIRSKLISDSDNKLLWDSDDPDYYRKKLQSLRSMYDFPPERGGKRNRKTKRNNRKHRSMRR